MAIPCKNCERMIPEEDLNMQTMIAVCPHCDHVFDFGDLLPEPPAVERILQAPDIFKVTEQTGGVTIAYSWFNWRAPVFLAAGLFIMGVPVLLLDVIGGTDAAVSVLLLLSLVLITLFAVALVYYSLAQFVNTTRITINGNSVQVRHTPVPMPGSVRLSSDSITQVLIEEHQYETEYGASSSYDVVALLKDDTQRALVRRLPRREHARYIDQQLRRYLKLSSPSNRLPV